MPLTVAFQMDHISGIKIAGDSTFALMLEAEARGHRLFHYTVDTMAMWDGKVTAVAEPVSVRDVAGDHYTLGAGERVDLSTFDVIHMRQDPPFDLAYISATHMLERIHPKTLVVNDPVEVRNAPEKLFVVDFADLMPPTLITRDRDAIKAFREEHGEVVIKPLYGHGGNAVFRLHPDDQNYGSLIGLFEGLYPEPWVIQRYLSEVRAGDKRILLVDGEFAGAVNRVPGRRRPALQHGAGRPGGGHRADAARARDLRAPRSGAEETRPHLRRHRRHRRLPDRDQRHLADGHPLGAKALRHRRRREGLGFDRGAPRLTEFARTAIRTD